MACSASSTVMASSTSSYDVFLSFRGEDTRHSFTDHLYHKLIHAGVCAFRDEEDINRGEELKPEIERAIKASRSSIVVLSENYATSTWCLEELVLILEQRRVFSHFVLPIFYHVHPTDVRKHTGSFAVEKDRWKTALTEVASLSGFTMSGPETRTLNEIVETIYNKLDEKEVHLPLNITGMAARYKDISFWLDQCNAEILAIYGMGGSGKTTLAKYIYNLNRRSFEYVSFVENIGNRCKTYNDLLELQKQLVKDIIGGKKRKVPSISRGICMIEEVLQTNRTLIVLDDIVEQSQLVALLGTGKINAESKIIITTRENIDNWYDFPYWRCQKYEMRLLNPDESLELFCRHAFQSEIHGVGYDSVVKYCEGNPLALEVLGSSMSKYNAHMIMPSQLRLFEIDMDSRIRSVLMRSYMSLPCNIVKELFLHIACFFIGIDIDYVVKILEPDYAARSGIQTLLEKCLLSVSPNKKVMMHRLLQEMAKSIVREESTKLPAKRSRVWLSSDSYNILNKRKGSKTIEALALDMKMLQKENFAFKASQLKTDALKNMEILKLLQLNFAELSGSYKYAFENLRWLCWHGFHLTTIPSDLYMGNLVAIDMSYSKLEVFEPPMVLQSLQILNLKDSHDLIEIRNILKVPNLHTLILWNCKSLVNVSDNLRDLLNLELLNMTGCKNLFNREQIECKASASGEVVKTLATFSFPFSLHRLFLKDCYIQRTHSFSLNFNVQPYLQYLNVSNSLFESLPCYGHLENLRVLDLSFCSRLKFLLCLPSTLAELYIYHCESLEKITFHSHRFPLQEFGYEGCVNLYEIEDYIKLVPIAKLDVNELGHMKWLKEYQNHEVCLVGDGELTVGRSWHIQMLYEFNIMSTSLPDIHDPNMTPEFRSESSYLSFNVPSCPINKRLIGINVTSKYSISGDDWAWFCKVNTTNGVVDLMYNPKVFGKPESGEVCMWLSYWPIGNTLDAGSTVDVSIVVMNGLEVHECGVSLVYSDKETIENNTGWEEIVAKDLSRFELSTGAYYLCRRNFFELVEVGRLTPDWFKILVGDTIDYTEVRGWSEIGRPKQVNPSFSELKTISCMIHGSQLEDIYDITEMSKSSIGDKTVAFTSSLIEEEMKSELIVETMENKDSSFILMGTDVAESVEKLPSPSDIKVHRAMCTELLKIVNWVDKIFPEIKAARPRGSSGIQSLCMLTKAIDKAKSVIRNCAESSKLYLALTGSTVLSRCKISKTSLEQSLSQIQNMVPVMLASKISQLIGELRSIKLSLDASEEEAGKAVRSVLEEIRTRNRSGNEFENEGIKIAAQMLQITSPKALLLERRSIKKLLRQITGEKNKQQKKLILLHLLDLLKKYGNSFTSGDTANVYVGQDKNTDGMHRLDLASLNLATDDTDEESEYSFFSVTNADSSDDGFGSDSGDGSSSNVF